MATEKRGQLNNPTVPVGIIDGVAIALIQLAHRQCLCSAITRPEEIFLFPIEHPVEKECGVFKSRRTNNLGVSLEKRRASQASNIMFDDGQHMMIRGEDGEMVEAEILGVREHESSFQKVCPVLPLPLAIICAALNIIPGLGTLLACILNLCFGLKEFDSPCGAFVKQIFTAILQVLLTPLIIGMIWSISYGASMVRKNREFVNPDPQNKA